MILRFMTITLMTAALSSVNLYAQDSQKDQAETAPAKAEEAKSETKQAPSPATENAANNSEKPAAGSDDIVTCTSNSDVRTIESKDGESGGCEVVYTKMGQANTVANAQNDLSYCGEVINRMKTNLEGAGFTCE